MESIQAHTYVALSTISKHRKVILITLLALSLSLATVGTALSIEVDQKGKTYQTTTYKFNFLGGLLDS